MKNLNNRTFLVADCLFVNMALFIGLIIRFDADIPEAMSGMIPFNFLITTIVSILIYNIFGIYSMLWNYASVEELLKIFWSTITSTIVQLLLATYFNVLFPVSVYIISWMITFYLVGSVRFIGRITKSIKIKTKKSTQKKE